MDFSKIGARSSDSFVFMRLARGRENEGVLAVKIPDIRLDSVKLSGQVLGADKQA